LRPRLLASIFKAEDVRDTDLTGCEDSRVVMGMSTPGDLPPERLFLENLELIKKLISFTNRRYRLPAEEAEEFSSRVMCKLIENDYGVFRKFDKRSSLRTYLGVVIQRQMLDYLDHLWGKWRPCEEARRMGPDVIRLDEILHRDGIEFDQAVQMLQKNWGVELSWQELEKIAILLPARFQRRTEGEEALPAIPDREPGPDHLVEEKEQAVLRRRVRAAFHRALDTLAAEDKVLVWMSTEYSVAGISRLLKLEQKPLYRRLAKIFAALRKAMEQEGIRKKDIDDILGKLEL
jgi:RNA polymerase sigma factor (sigma-70 family)